MLLQNLIAEGKIRINDCAVLHSEPVPLSGSFNFNKIEGMLLAAVIGNCLGATTNFMNPFERHGQYGQIKDYLPNRHFRNSCVGVPTSDTQLTFLTIGQLIADVGLVPDNLASTFCNSYIYGIPNTVRCFEENYKDKKVPWNAAGIDSLGNGAVMRIAPVILPNLRQPTRNLYADAALAGMVTHNNYVSNAVCVTFVKMLWDLMNSTSCPPPSWWLDSFCDSMSQLEGENVYTGHPESLWKITRQLLVTAMSRGTNTLNACNSWGSGSDLFETMPSVLYILMRHCADPEQAIIRAVNDTRDNDTIAALVGAAIGALYGKARLPDRWISKLTGRISKTGNFDEIGNSLILARTTFAPLSAAIPPMIPPIPQAKSPPVNVHNAPPPRKPTVQPAVNQILEGRYELLNQIKTGGMAVIWKATDRNGGGTCIVKQSKDDPDPQMKKQFDDKLAMERAYLCQWNHPNIVKYRDFFTDKGDSYLVVDFIDGQDLFAAFKYRPASEATALGLADQMLRVLEYIHAQGLVHRDFNPGNMMLRPDGQLVVIDFGTIKAGGTQGTTIGKPGFNIPELVVRGYSDARSDIYGTGATLFYILTSLPPGSSGAVRPFDLLIGRGISNRTAACLQQALSMDPAHRFKDAATMRSTLLG